MARLMSYVLFIILMFLSVVSIASVSTAEALEVAFQMDEETYARLCYKTFGWLHMGSESSPVYGRSEGDKLHHAVNYVLPFASFGRIKSLESEGITMEVRR